MQSTTEVSPAPGRRVTPFTWFILGVAFAGALGGAYWLGRQSVQAEARATADASIFPFTRWQARFNPGRATAKMQMQKLQTAIDMYYASNKRLPDSLKALAQPSEGDPEPYLNEIPKDPWDNDFDYRTLDQKKYTIRSWGEDGQPDTADDIIWPERQDK
jgi:general secretion pathway protein G